MVKLTIDATGRTTATNSAAPPKIITHTVSFDCPAADIPTAPHPNCVPEANLESALLAHIAKMRTFLTTRPIATRRCLLNHLGRAAEYDLKAAVQYAGYVFASGPWRDSVVAFGLDPRTDPKYRIYQTLIFKIMQKEKPKWQHAVQLRVAPNPDEDPNAPISSHMFDGKSVIVDGKVWQACDITDPLLRGMLDRSPVRATCDIYQDGWYPNGTWAKMKVLMRDKIAMITAGVPVNDALYEKLAAIPDVLTRENLDLAIFDRARDGGLRVIQMAGDIRALSRVRVGKVGVPKGPYEVVDGKEAEGGEEEGNDGEEERVDGNGVEMEDEADEVDMEMA